MRCRAVPSPRNDTNHSPLPTQFRFPTIFPPVNRGVVVTGASSGIGAAIARDLAARGFRVFGTVRREQDGPPLEAAHVVPVLMDVTDAASIARARDEVSRALAGAPLAGLVNNAGIPSAGPLELVPLDQLRHVLEVNLVGAVAVTQAFLPLLKAARGRVVNISSLAWRVGRPVAKALTARRPPLRILVVESQLGYRLMELLPDRLMDWLIARVLWKKAQ